MSRKTWLITGISSGLGQAISEAVIESGDFMIGTFRKSEEVSAFNNRGIKNAKAILLDITDSKMIEERLNEVTLELKNIDVLVNNAGVGFAGAIEESSLEETRAVFEANFFGTLKLTQTILPIMRQERKGHIIQISSHGGLKAFAGFGIYNASKFALEGFSEALAQEVNPLGIHVSIIEPGPFRTNFAGERLRMAEKKIDDYSDTAGQFRNKLKAVHGKQEGDPEKAAQAIIDLVRSQNPSLRLPLGKVALMTIGMKLESVKSDLEKNRSIAESVVF